MLKFKVRFEHWVIILLAFLLVLETCGHRPPEKTKVTTTLTEKKITETDSTSNNEIKNQVPEKVQVLEFEDSIRILNKARIDSLSSEEKSRVKAINHYQDTTKLKNAVIYSDIFSEGRILKYDLSTSITHLERTIREKKETTQNAGGLFLSPTVNYFPDYGISGAGTGLTYIKKNLGITAGVLYDIRARRIGFTTTLHIKL